MKKWWLAPILVSGLVLSLSACDDDDDIVDSNTGGGLTVASNISTVEGDMIPSSLGGTTASAVALGADEDVGNPCANLVDENGDPVPDDQTLFACQPRLLRLYLDMGREMVAMTGEMVGEVATDLDALPDGTETSVSVDGLEIDVDKTDDENFALLFKNSSSEPGLHLTVSGGTNYTLQADLSVLEDGETGKLEVAIEYTDEDTYTVIYTMVGGACDPDDVAAPKNMNIKINKVDGLWVGGAALYMPRWWPAADGVDNTCDTETTDGTKVFMVTRFVGNETAAKAEVALMKHATPEISAITTATMGTYALNNFFTTFLGGNCWGGNCPTLTDYSNPFCSEGSSNFGTWNSDCTGVDVDVAGAAFSSADLIAPEELEDYEVTLPASLL